MSPQTPVGRTPRSVRVPPDPRLASDPGCNHHRRADEGVGCGPGGPPQSVRQAKYDARNPVVRFVVGRFFVRLRAVLAEVDPHSVLDAGSGEGEILRRDVLPAGVRPVCLDMRLAPLKQVAAAQRVCGSVLSLPFAARSFDTVTCLEVLEHLPNPAAALSELTRVARRAVVVSVPFEPYFRIGNLLRGNHLRGLGNHPEHVQHWNPRTFHAFLSSSMAEVRIFEAFPWIIACCRPSQL